MLSVFITPPWRSFEHLAGKLRDGRATMAETQFGDEICQHWRTGGSWSDARLAAAWATLCAGRPVPELAWSPIGESALPHRVRYERGRPSWRPPTFRAAVLTPGSIERR